MIKKTCIECCPPICDFCKFFEDIDDNGEGTCTNEKNEKMKVDCTDSCGYFKCNHWEEL